MALSVCKEETDSRGRELVEHGSAAFPIACYQDELENHVVPWHWHEEMEFIIVHEGVLEVHVENDRLLLHPGEGLFINSGVLHFADKTEGRRVILHSLVFHARLVGGSMDSIFWQKLIQPLQQDTSFRYLPMKPSCAWQKEMIDRMGQTWEAVAGETAEYENQVRYQLTSALHLLNNNREITIRSSSEQERVVAKRMKLMMQYIEEHYAEELTVAEIAGAALVSESVCLRCFRQITGTTPIQYVKRLRIDKAAGLLLATEEKAVEIAMECGFSDISYFTRSFRQQKGCTPLEYRSNYSIRAQAT